MVNPPKRGTRSGAMILAAFAVDREKKICFVLRIGHLCQKLSDELDVPARCFDRAAGKLVRHAGRCNQVSLSLSGSLCQLKGP
jgi:hypothetical protein